jgi:hypothetical protein
VTGKGFMPAVRATTWLRGSRRLQKERTYGRGLADFTIDLLDGKLIDGETVYPAKEPGGEPTVIRYQQTPPPRQGSRPRSGSRTAAGVRRLRSWP